MVEGPAIRSEADFRALELEWRSALAGKSLVIEANANPATGTAALAILGSNYQRQPSRDDRERLLRRYPAVLLVGVCATASRYEMNTFWPLLEEPFGELTQTDRQTIATSFKFGLDHLRLSRFDFPRANVDEMLMHAGIPGQRMDEFMRLLLARDRRRPDLDGAQFCSWLSSVSVDRATAQYELDVPTYRFLTQAGEIAEDLVDRCLDLLDEWRTGHAALDVSGFPLVMQPDLLRALEEMAAAGITHERAKRDRRVATAPHVVFTVKDGVAVQLPPLELVADSRVEWLIAFEGTVVRQSVEPPWPGDPVQIHRAAVTRVAKEIAVRAEPGGLDWALTLVDPEDPLLVFDESSRDLIPTRNSLPRGDVVLAFPNPEGRPLDELVEVEGAVEGFQAIESPYGWSLWTFCHVSLTEVSRLRFHEASSWRHVSSIRRPSIEGVLPIAHSKAPGGDPVWGAPPNVTLPGLDPSISEGGEVEWTISATHLARNVEVWKHSYRVGSTALQVDLDETPLSAALGEYEISVRGPLGRGTSRRMTIAAGVAITADHEFRALGAFGEGLVPSGFTIAAPAEVRSPRRVELPPTAPIGSVSLCRDESRLDFFVAIPAMRIVLDVDGDPVFNSHGPVQVDLEDLPRTSLRITVERVGIYELVAMQSGELVQTVRATVRVPGGTARFPLAQLSDAFALSGGGQLVLANVDSRIPVGRVRPRQLVEQVVFDGGNICLLGRVNNDPLELAVYPRYAPWREPVVLTAIDERVEAPADLLNEKKARVVVRWQDPWVPQQWSHEYPVRGENTFDVEFGELHEVENDPMWGMRSWLARLSPCPPVDARLPEAIRLYAGTQLDKYRTPGAELRAELAARISTVRERVLAEYVAASLPTAPIDLFVAADVVTLPPTSRDRADALWESSPFLAAVATDFRSGPQADRAVRALGDSVTEILREGRDPHASTGRFGDNEILLSRWPEDRIEAVWKSVSPVPGRLLEQETRLIAAKQLFDARLRLPFDPRPLTQTLRALVPTLARECDPKAVEILEARQGSSGWTNMPQLSLALGLLARAAARGSVRAASLYSDLKSTHVGLARVAPLIVEQDVVLAEIWLSRWSDE